MERSLAPILGDHRLRENELISRENAQGELDLNWDFPSTGYYSVLMTDSDAPTPSDPSESPFLHWLVVNIKGSLESGEERISYKPPSPPAGSKPHRYTIEIYRQPGKVSAAPIKNRTKFNRLAFSRDNERVASITFRVSNQDQYTVDVSPVPTSRFDRAMGIMSDAGYPSYTKHTATKGGCGDSCTIRAGSPPRTSATRPVTKARTGSPPRASATRPVDKTRAGSPTRAVTRGGCPFCGGGTRGGCGCNVRAGSPTRGECGCGSGLRPLTNGGCGMCGGGKSWTEQFEDVEEKTNTALTKFGDSLQRGTNKVVRSIKGGSPTRTRTRGGADAIGTVFPTGTPTVVPAPTPVATSAPTIVSISVPPSSPTSVSIDERAVTKGGCGCGSTSPPPRSRFDAPSLYRGGAGRSHGPSHDPAAFCRCVLKVEAKNPGSCASKNFSKEEGCYNPYAVCAASTGTSTGRGSCSFAYNVDDLPYAELQAYTRLLNKEMMKDGYPEINYRLPQPKLLALIHKRKGEM